jgi:hypothetical protein
LFVPPLLLVHVQGVTPALRTFNTLIIACNMCNQPREALAGMQQSAQRQQQQGSSRHAVRAAAEALHPSAHAHTAA